MNSFRLLDRRNGYLVAAFALVLSAIVPAIAAAATQATNRSIELSNSSAGAENVIYRVNFKATGAAQAFVVEFCGDSPLIGAACGATPAGFTAANAETTTTDYTVESGATAGKVIISSDIAAGENVSVALGKINNSSVAGPLYARIVTYSSLSGATGYTSINPGEHVDEGGVAMYITDTVGVAGAVRESLTFCVAKNPIQPDCYLVGNPKPVLQLGKEEGGTKTLDSAEVYTGEINTQLSTNAAGGVVISLKSNALGCGGLLRSGAAPGTCDIKPALQTGILAGQAKFGLKTGADVTDPTDGTLRAIPSSGYNSTTFALNFDADGEDTGVTSVYGDPILDTNSAPANNRNMALTFGASVTNTTPAGLYSADLSLIATGKF